MAAIVIKDLTDSIDLDREAMIAITGGARTRGMQTNIPSTIFRTTRIVSYPPGFAGKPSTEASKRPAGGTRRK